MENNERPTNLYYFRDGSRIEAFDSTEAVRLHRVQFGAAPAIIEDVEPMDEVWMRAAEMSRG